MYRIVYHFIHAHLMQLKQLRVRVSDFRYDPNKVIGSKYALPLSADEKCISEVHVETYNV